MRRLVVGTRASKLSMAQTKIVTNLLLSRSPDLQIDTVTVRTLGDRLPPEKRGSVDGKTAFTGDIESMLIKGTVDIAVHSLKDLPSEMDERLIIAATPPRGDWRDVLVSKKRQKLSELPQGAKVGTSSLRRKAQLLRMRDDIEVVELHGNVETRLRRMQDGLDGVILAAAGLERMSASGRIAQYFTIDEMVPAVGQAIIAVQSRKEDEETKRILFRIDDPKARVEASCERAFSQRLGGDCNVPVGAHADLSGESLSVVGMIASPDGKKIIKKVLSGMATEADSLGNRLAKELLDLGGERILVSVK